MNKRLSRSEVIEIKHKVHDIISVISEHLKERGEIQVKRNVTGQYLMHGTLSTTSQSVDDIFILRLQEVLTLRLMKQFGV